MQQLLSVKDARLSYCRSVASRNEVMVSSGQLRYMLLPLIRIIQLHYAQIENLFKEPVLRRCAVYWFSREGNPKSSVKYSVPAYFQETSSLGDRPGPSFTHSFNFPSLESTDAQFPQFPHWPHFLIPFSLFPISPPLSFSRLLSLRTPFCLLPNPPPPSK